MESRTVKGNFFFYNNSSISSFSQFALFFVLVFSYLYVVRSISSGHTNSRRNRMLGTIVTLNPCMENERESDKPNYLLFPDTRLQLVILSSFQLFIQIKEQESPNGYTYHFKHKQMSFQWCKKVNIQILILSWIMRIQLK